MMIDFPYAPKILHYRGFELIRAKKTSHLGRQQATQAGARGASVSVLGWQRLSSVGRTAAEDRTRAEAEARTP